VLWKDEISELRANGAFKILVVSDIWAHLRRTFWSLIVCGDATETIPCDNLVHLLRLGFIGNVAGTSTCVSTRSKIAA
jgi:hypothetical protein